MKRIEMTAEQLFQEAYFADRCIESGDPLFMARGEKILKLHEESNRIKIESDQVKTAPIEIMPGELVDPSQPIH